MTAVETAATTSLWASSALTVAMRAQAVVLPRSGAEPEVPLGLAELRAIQALVSDAGLTVDDSKVPFDGLIAALRARLMVLEHPPRETVDPKGGEIGPTDSAPTLSGDVVLPTPFLLRCGPAGFEYVDHDGAVRARLSAVEVLAAVHFGLPTTVATALEAHAATLGSEALSEFEFRALVERLQVAELLVPFDPQHPVHARQTRQAEQMRDGMRRQAQVHAEFDRIEAEHDAAAPSTDRTRVIGVHPSWSGLPASLAMIIAAAKQHEGGILEESFDFRPRLFWDPPRLEQAADGSPGIFLFSNYIWSTSPQSRAVRAGQGTQSSPHHGARRPRHAEVPRRRRALLRQESAGRRGRTR